MTIKFAERMTRLGTEGAFEVLARARKLEAEGKKIVHLEIGEPDFATPDNIIEAGISALQNGYTHYTPASGIREVREAVAKALAGLPDIYREVFALRDMQHLDVAETAEVLGIGESAV